MIFLIIPYSNQCNINTTISLLISDSASNTTFFPHNIKSDAPFFSLFENPRVLAAVTSMANEQKARKLEVSESLEVPMKFHFKMGFPLRNKPSSLLHGYPIFWVSQHRKPQLGGVDRMVQAMIDNILEQCDKVSRMQLGPAWRWRQVQTWKNGWNKWHKNASVVH